MNESFYMENLPANTDEVVSVTLRYYARRYSVGHHDFRPYFVLDGSPWFGDAVTTNGIYAWYTVKLDDNPLTGNARTYGEVNALQGGMSTASGLPDYMGAQIASMDMVVGYTVS